MNQGNEESTISMPKGEYDELMQLKVELRQRRVDDKVKAMGSTKSDIIRKRIALRRIEIKSLAPNCDLVAYDAIHKLKNPAGESTQKVIVTDNEIEAYKQLDPDFNRTVSLTDVLDKVARMKVAGELTEAGDNPDNGVEVIEEQQL